MYFYGIISLCTVMILRFCPRDSVCTQCADGGEGVRSMRIRIGIALTAALLAVLLLCASASASAGMTCDYTPRSTYGTVFYIDVYSDTALSAAVCEMRFDSSVAEHRSVTPAANTSSVRCRSENGTVRIAFADSGAVKGHLFRVSFKAISAETCDFVLHTVQAVDGDLNYIDGFSDFTLTVTLSKKDTASSACSGSAKRREKSSASEKSGQSQKSARGDASAGARLQTAVNFETDRKWTYFGFGAGAVMLTAGLVLLGYLIGHKARMKRQNSLEPEEWGSLSSDDDSQ